MAAHQHWRINVTTGMSTAWLALGELEMRTSVGGANVCTGGTASSSNLPNSPASNAFDGSLTTYWQSGVAPTYPQFLRYSFAAPVDIVQVVLKATSNVTWAEYGPKDCDIQWSDDGTTWTTLFTASGMNVWTTSTVYTATLGFAGAIRTTQQSLEVLGSPSSTPARATQQSLEVLYEAAYAAATIPGFIYQVNSGSTYSDPVNAWNNDPDAGATTLTGLVPSVGGSSSVTYSSPSWDSVQTDGVAHADLPTGVSASYLKWYASARVVTFGNVNPTKTYTLKLYSTAPGSVSVNWTVGASTKALVRGSKVEWTGLVPDGSLQITATSASTASGGDATLSAAILVEEQTQTAPTLTVRATLQSLEAMVATYQQRWMKSVGYAVLGVQPGVSIAKAVGLAVLSDPGFVSDTQTVLLLHFESPANSTAFVDYSPSNKLVTPVGATYHTTSNFKFGTAAGTFDGVGDYLSVAANADFSFGSGPFTVEGWVRLVANAQFGLVGSWSASTATQSWFLFREGNNLVFRIYDSGGSSRELTAALTWTIAQYYHLAADRAADGTLRLYRDGVVVASGAFAHTIRDVTQPLTIGSVGGFSTYDFNGQMDELRISRVARYQGAFTPATSAFTEPVVTPVSATRRWPVVAIIG
jgi:hypothetical protein